MSDPLAGLSAKTRQTLRELAAQTGKSVQEILDLAVEGYRRKLFLDAVNASYAALRADPQAWAEVEAERQSMAGSLLTGSTRTSAGGTATCYRRGDRALVVA
jgi:hypothetical protein